MVSYLYLDDNFDINGIKSEITCHTYCHNNEEMSINKNAKNLPCLEGIRYCPTPIILLQSDDNIKNIYGIIIILSVQLTYISVKFAYRVYNINEGS